MPKRRRTASSATDSGHPDDEGMQTAEPPERSEAVWMEDGNIILQAENVQFKVHRSVLSKHSPVFADLFKVPQPGNEPTVDGCPIVELHDHAEDLKHVLLMLYCDPLYFMPSDRLHFLVVAAMMRLGKKYEIDHLREQALARLKREFPCTLAEYNELDTRDWTHFLFPYDETYDTGHKMKLSMVNLAHECNLNTILPALYFTFICSNIATLFDTQENHLTIPYHAMSRCMVARASLCEARLKKVHGWVRQVGTSAVCRSPQGCLANSRLILQSMLDDPLYLTDLFYDWADFIDDLPEDQQDIIHQLCDPCLVVAKASHRQAREKVWASLPALFELPPWQDLKDFDN
ncbi:hypothetical protein NMY22_g9225 [Coprinellus aureogranulatus]|nr:hypothetical protein NMY22_g9225 [Coprinellus aureogranulatus]